MWILWAFLADDCFTRMDGLVTKAHCFLEPKLEPWKCTVS